VINSNLPRILHRVRDIAFDRSKIDYLATPVTPPTEAFPWDDLRKIFSWMLMDGQDTKYRRKITEIYSRLSRVHERYRQTTNRQTTDGRAIAYTERERELTFAKTTTKLEMWANAQRDIWSSC